MRRPGRIIMELRVGFLIGFLLLAGPPLRVCRGSSQTGETRSARNCSTLLESIGSGPRADFAKAEEE